MGLTLNGARLTQSETAVSLTSSAAPTAYTQSTVINARCGEVLSFVCHGQATIPQPTQGIPARASKP